MIFRLEFFEGGKPPRPLYQHRDDLSWPEKIYLEKIWYHRNKRSWKGTLSFQKIDNVQEDTEKLMTITISNLISDESITVDEYQLDYFQQIK